MYAILFSHSLHLCIRCDSVYESWHPFMQQWICAAAVVVVAMCSALIVCLCSGSIESRKKKTDKRMSSDWMRSQTIYIILMMTLRQGYEYSFVYAIIWTSVTQNCARVIRTLYIIARVQGPDVTTRKRKKNADTSDRLFNAAALMQPDAIYWNQLQHGVLATWYLFIRNDDYGFLIILY